LPAGSKLVSELSIHHFVIEKKPLGKSKTA